MEQGAHQSEAPTLSQELGDRRAISGGLCFKDVVREEVFLGSTKLFISKRTERIYNCIFFKVTTPRKV